MDGPRKDETLANENDPDLSLVQASAALGVAVATVKSMALRKEIESKVSAGRVVITKESVRNYLARTTPADQPAEAGAR